MPIYTEFKALRISNRLDSLMSVVNLSNAHKPTYLTSYFDLLVTLKVEP